LVGLYITNDTALDSTVSQKKQHVISLKIPHLHSMTAEKLNLHWPPLPGSREMFGFALFRPFASRIYVTQVSAFLWKRILPVD